MLGPISDRRESPPAAIIVTIRQLYLQKLLNRIMAHFPLPERRGKLAADKSAGPI